MKGLSLSNKVMIPHVVSLSILIIALSYLLSVAKQEQNSLFWTTQKIKRQNSLLAQIGSIRQERQRVLLSYRFNRRASHLEVLSGTNDIVRDLIEDLIESSGSARERDLIERIAMVQKRLTSIQGELLNRMRDGVGGQISIIFDQWTVHASTLDALLADLTALNLRSLDRELHQMETTRVRAIAVITATVALLSLLIVLLWVVIRLRLIRPLLQLTRTTKAIAEGDLSVRAKGGDRLDEIGLLARSLNDMTARLHEAKTLLNAKVEELNRSNGDLQQFAYVCSHDLKEPLRIVGLYAQLLERQCGDHLDPNVAEYVAFIKDGANRMNGLVDDLLRYARVGGQEEPSMLVDCNEVIEIVKNDLTALIDETKATILVDSLPSVSGKRPLLVQLFENLISNALKFRGKEAPVIRIRGVEDRKGWTISVSDNGIGIDPQFFEQVFVIFQRLHGRSEYSGSGIGLAICKKIVERHRGRIWVESAPGKGSTFKFSLPRLVGA